MPPPNAPVPPHNLDAERTTLGALLVDGDAMADVAPILAHDDFYDPVHAAIFAAMHRLYEDRSPIDYMTVSAALDGNEKIRNIGGPAFLAELAAAVPTSSHVKKYAEIVREKSLRRQLANYGTSVAKLADADDKSSAELLESAEKRLLQLSRQSTGTKPAALNEIAADRYEHYTAVCEAEDPAAYYGITTGYPKLDHLITGLPPGHLMVLAGRPSMGKTALALNIAEHVAFSRAKSVLFFSLEMTKDQLFDRIFAGLLGVEASRLRGGGLTEEELRRMGPTIDAIKPDRLFIDDDTDTTLANLRSKARRHQMEHGLDLLVVDYLQLIEVTDRAASENQTQRITYISKNLKNLARELRCPIIALSQLSRSCEQRTPPIPVPADLRDSGAIEQDADTILMLYREGYYNEECEDPDLTDVYVRKNRQGPTGRVELHFNKERMTYETLS